MGATERLTIGLSLDGQACTLDESIARALELGPGSPDGERIAQAALAIDPSHGGALHFLGIAAVTRGDFSAGADWLNRASISAPGDPQVFRNLAACMRLMGDKAAAEKAYRKTIELAPRYLDAWLQLGSLLTEEGRYLDAAYTYQEAAHVNPKHAECWRGFGFALYHLEYYDKAEVAYSRYLYFMPHDVDGHLNLATMARHNKHFDVAETAYLRALELDPSRHNTLLGLARLRGEMGRHADALVDYERCLALFPEDADAWYGLAISRDACGDMAGAIDSYRTAVRYRPDFSQAWNNLGTLLNHVRDVQGAIDAFSRVLEISPDHADARWNLALMQLLAGRFLEGWRHYESRMDPNCSVAHKFVGPNHGKPMWRGEPLQGKTVLFWPEQGFGDYLHFCRYAQHVKAAGARVVIGSKPELKTLLETLPWADQIIADARELHGDLYDYWVFPMSLPHRFGTTLENIPAEVPYLFADPEKIAYWREKLAPWDGRKKVGVIWAGNPGQGGDRFRSMQIKDLAPLAELSGVAFFSLQKGPKTQELSEVPAGLDITPLGDELQDFGDTAALMKCLDLVISVCSGPAHLAGAIGCPVWIPLAFNGCWRWLQERDDSPWYPTLRLFRQKALFEWRPVMEAIRDELAKVVAGTESVFLPGGKRLPPPKSLGIGWQLSELHGWGIFGINVVRELGQRGHPEVRILDIPVLDETSTAELAGRIKDCEALNVAQQSLGGAPLFLPGTVVTHAFGNDFSGPGMWRRFSGARNAGFIFFEENHFSEAGLAIGRKMDTMLAGSRWNTELLKEWGFADARYVMQGVDVARFRKRPKQGRYGERFVVFSGGKLEFRKGQDLVLAAFREFHRRHPDALLVCAWHNPWPLTAQNIAESRLGLDWPGLDPKTGQLDIAGWLMRNGIPEDAFIDIGLVNNRDMPAVFSEVDVAVFPNRAEGGTNLVAMEAMASGVPIILSANTGHLDLIGEGNCLCLEKQTSFAEASRAGWGESDIDEIVERLEKAYGNRRLLAKLSRLGEAFMQEYSWAKQTSRLLDALGLD